MKSSTRMFVFVLSTLVFASAAEAGTTPTLVTDPICHSSGYLCVRLSSLPGGSIAEAITQAPFKPDAKRPAEEEVVNLRANGAYPNMASFWTVLGSWDEPEHVDNLVHGITTPAEARAYAAQAQKPFLAFTRRAVTPSFPFPDAVIVIPGQGRPIYEELEARLAHMATDAPKIECAQDELYNPRTQKCVKTMTAMSVPATNLDAGAATCQKHRDWRWNFDAHRCTREVVAGTIGVTSRHGFGGNMAALWLLSLGAVVLGMGRIHRAELRVIKSAALVRIHTLKTEFAMSLVRTGFLMRRIGQIEETLVEAVRRLAIFDIAHQAEVEAHVQTKAELAATRSNFDQVVGRTTAELSAVRAELASARMAHAAELQRLRVAHSNEMVVLFEQVARINDGLEYARKEVISAKRRCVAGNELVAFLEIHGPALLYFLLHPRCSLTSAKGTPAHAARHAGVALFSCPVPKSGAAARKPTPPPPVHLVAATA